MSNLEIFPIPALHDNYIWGLHFTESSESGLRRNKDEVRSQGGSWSEERSVLEVREYRSPGSNAEFGPEPTISHKSSECVIVDPGETQPVIQALLLNRKEYGAQNRDIAPDEKRSVFDIREHHSPSLTTSLGARRSFEEGLLLSAILVTHHHWDHTNGIEALIQQYPGIPVWGPKQEQHRIPSLTHPIQAGDSIHLFQNQLSFRVLSIPGHTLGHVAYYGEPKEGAPILFCGDTLFGGGCGRIFEGTAEQLYHSLMQLSQLPDHTQIYCGHEYTLNNLRFAHELEPDYLPVKKRLQSVLALRAQSKPTLPSTLAEEKQSNPFFRCDAPSLVQAVLSRFPGQKNTPFEIFKHIRQLKDEWHFNAHER